MSLQITCHDKATQTYLTIEEVTIVVTQNNLLVKLFEEVKLLKEQVTLLTTEVAELKVQSEHSKKQEKAKGTSIVQEEHFKKLDLEGDVRTHLKTEMVVTCAGTSGTAKELPTKIFLPKSELPKKKNYNQNKIFEKLYASPNIQKNELFVSLQLYPY